MAQRENKVERFLQKRVEAVGGACAKFRGTVRGEPDRLLSFPSRYQCLVETKWAEDVEPEPHQLRRHDWWRKRGMDVYVVRSLEEVTLFMIKMRVKYERD
jgi:hypothetical protein